MHRPRAPLALAVTLVLPALAACDRPATVELEPASLAFHARGQQLPVHATPRARSGKAMPASVCTWSSSDEKVATVSGPHNAATVTSVGPGTATVRCAADGATGELTVTVRTIAKVAVRPSPAMLMLADEPAPLPLEVVAIDAANQLVTGRPAFVTCKDESVCRGDARGQVWPVGPGETTATVRVEEGSTELAVRVVDARTEASRPRRVNGEPMREIERYVREKEARERRR